MRRNVWLFGVAIYAGLLVGCVERRYVITSDPPGALVQRNGQTIGAAPVDDHFVYSGNYHFTLVKDGYQTLQVDQKVATPWYEFPGLDFISEALVPFHIEDVQRFNYTMCPLQAVNSNTLLQQAEQRRGEGKAIVSPTPVPEPLPTQIPPTQP